MIIDNLRICINYLSWIKFFFLLLLWLRLAVLWRYFEFSLACNAPSNFGEYNEIIIGWRKKKLNALSTFKQVSLKILVFGMHVNYKIKKKVYLCLPEGFSRDFLKLKMSSRIISKAFEMFAIIVDEFLIQKNYVIKFFRSIKLDCTLKIEALDFIKHNFTVKNLNFKWSLDLDTLKWSIVIYSHRTYTYRTN